jgi:hypothetical protein
LTQKYEKELRILSLFPYFCDGSPRATLLRRSRAKYPVFAPAPVRILVFRSLYCGGPDVGSARILLGAAVRMTAFRYFAGRFLTALRLLFSSFLF